MHDPAEEREQDQRALRALWEAVMKLTERVGRLEAKAGIRRIANGNPYDLNEQAARLRRRSR